MPSVEPILLKSNTLLITCYYHCDETVIILLQFNSNCVILHITQCILGNNITVTC